MDTLILDRTALLVSIPFELLVVCLTLFTKKCLQSKQSSLKMILKFVVDVKCVKKDQLAKNIAKNVQPKDRKDRQGACFTKNVELVIFSEEKRGW